MKLLVCNAAWMNWYRGLQRGDRPVHGGSFVKRHGYGHELLKFAPNGKHYYGYVQARFGSIDIDRLGAPGRPYVDDVLLVWRARSPAGSVVVGWYKNARVYRAWQEGNAQRRIKHKGKFETVGWYIRAPISGSRLLPPRFRTLKWPASSPGFGSTTFVSFLEDDRPEVRSYRMKLVAYIKRVEAGQLGPPARGKRPAPDSDLNLRIERAGVDRAMKYYHELGYSVESVENEKRGYDLVATAGTHELLVEVTSTSIKDPAEACVGLTANEFSRSKFHRATYRICIVLDALDKPQLREYQWEPQAKRWFDLTSISHLAVQIVQAANLTIVHPPP